jgi:hypothetical protein
MDDDSGEMNTNEAALQIGIPAKKLRGYIRADPDNLGVAQQDGRWVFSQRDVARLRNVLNPKVEVQSGKETDGGELTPYQKLVISRKDARVNREVMERHIKRIDKLEAGLRRAGLHISQQSLDDRK